MFSPKHENVPNLPSAVVLVSSIKESSKIMVGAECQQWRIDVFVLGSRCELLCVLAASLSCSFHSLAVGTLLLMA